MKKDKIELDNVRINISIFIIATFLASILLFEKYVGWNYERNIITSIISIIYIFGYGLGSLLLLLYISTRALHYRYKNKNYFGSRDTLKIPEPVQEKLYDFGVDTVTSGFILAIVITVVLKTVWVVFKLITQIIN